MLIEAVNRHIDLCRSMGFKYRVQAYMLRSFADFAQRRSEEFIRTDSVLEWATSAPSRHIAALSTYLGHAHVSDTYWYLQATPRLLSDVAAAAEALYQGGER